MVIRMFLRYIANNEKLIDRMADSYVIRRAARLAVSLMYRAKSLTYDQRIKEITPESFRRFMATFKNNIKHEIENAKQKLEKKK